MQRPKTDTNSLSPWWGKKEQTESVNVPLMIGTRVPYNSGISTSYSNPISFIQACGNGNMSLALAG